MMRLPTRASNEPELADFSIRSVMCAPLWSQEGKAVGVIQLDTQDRRKKFNQDDLNLLVGVASQASIALENAKLHLDGLARERLQARTGVGARSAARAFAFACPR